MWQTKYASAVHKNSGVGVDFRPCSEDDFLTGRPQSVMGSHPKRIRGQLVKMSVPTDYILTAQLLQGHTWHLYQFLKLVQVYIA